MRFLKFTSIVSVAVLLATTVSAQSGNDAKSDNPAAKVEQGYAKVSMSKKTYLIGVDLNSTSAWCDLDNDGKRGDSEVVSGTKKDWGTPLYHGQESVKVTFKLGEPFGQVNVEWNPARAVPKVLITRGPLEQTTELSFSLLESSPDKARTLPFDGKKKVFAVYGTPFTPHRENPKLGPVLCVRVGYPGEVPDAVTKCHNSLKTDRNPVATIVFDPSDDASKDKPQIVNLDERCCGSQFKGAVTVPEKWSSARVKVTFPNPPEGWTVEPLELTINAPGKK